MQIAQCHIEISTLGKFAKKVHFDSVLTIELLPHNSSETVLEVEEVQKHFTRVVGAEIIETANQLEQQNKFEEANHLIE